MSPIRIESISVESFTITPQQTQAPASQQAQPQQQQGRIAYLGVAVSKTDGGFLVLESESTNLKNGDILTRIDSYNLKEFDIERVAAYAAQRSRQNATIKMTVLRDGETKIVEFNKAVSRLQEVSQPQQVTLEQYTEAKRIACREYLNINPDYFDESNPLHRTALEVAVGVLVEQNQR